MPQPPRLPRISAETRRRARRDAQDLAAAYNLSPAAKRAVRLLLLSGEQPADEVCDELCSAGLVELVPARELARRLDDTNCGLTDAPCNEAMMLYLLTVKLLGGNAGEAPMLLSDVADWRRRAAAYRAVQAAGIGGAA